MTKKYRWLFGSGLLCLIVIVLCFSFEAAEKENGEAKTDKEIVAEQVMREITPTIIFMTDLEIEEIERHNNGEEINLVNTDGNFVIEPIDDANEENNVELTNSKTKIENQISKSNLENENQNSNLKSENENRNLDSDFEKAFWECATKTYGDWSCITMTGSKQWELLHNTSVAVCEDGMLRDDEGYICAALGSYFGEIGSRWIFILENGNQIPVIKCDEKADSHTLDERHTVGINTDIIEFYIDVATHRVLGNVKGNGFVWWGNFNNCSEYAGTVVGWKDCGNIFS